MNDDRNDAEPAPEDSEKNAISGDDQSDGDQPEADQPADDQPAEPTPDERIEQVGERIDRARAQAEEALGDPEQTFVERRDERADEEKEGTSDGAAEQTYVESGDEQSEEADDQTIAPPG